MSKNLIKIAWLCLFFTYVTAYGLLLRQDGSSRYILSILFLFCAGIFSLLYLTVRIFAFKRKLVKFLKHLLSGNYEAGIKTRIYDEQRADKVAVNFRVRELIFNNASRGVIIADIEKEIFQFNPTARSIFDVNQDNFTFDSLKGKESNRSFFELLNAALEQENKGREERRISIDLPVSKIKKEVDIRIFPLKDRSEKVMLAVIFLADIN